MLHVEYQYEVVNFYEIIPLNFAPKACSHTP